MARYWTCDRCKKVQPYEQKYYWDGQPSSGVDPDTIGDNLVCKSCLKAALKHGCTSKRKDSSHARP